MSKTEWQVIRLLARSEYLGTVVAPDEQAAMKAALKMFGLEKVEEKRLLLPQSAETRNLRDGHS